MPHASPSGGERPVPSPGHAAGERGTRLFGSRWGGWIQLFTLAFLGSAATGYVLTARDALDLAAYFTLRSHVAFGYAGLLLGATVTVVHLHRLYGRRVAALSLLIGVVFLATAATDLGPLGRLGVPVGLLAYLTWFHFLRQRTTAPWVVLVGVASFLGLLLLYATGWFVAGPFKAIRTGAFSRLHDTVGWIAPPLVLFHLLHRYPLSEDRRWPLRLLAVLAAAAGTTLAITGRVAAPPSPPLASVAALAASGRVASEEQTCGLVGCHTEIGKQWKVSAHRFSSENRPYLAVAALAEAELGPEGRAFCLPCHEPSALLPAPRGPYGGVGPRGGASPGGLSPPGEGHVSCRACHVVERVPDPPANGRAEHRIEPPFLPELDLSRPPDLARYHDYVRLNLRDHRRAYRRPALPDPDLCESCHRTVVPASLNGGPALELDGPAGSWRRSPFAAQGVGCTHCHLQLFAFSDPESMELEFHARPDHRFLGIHAHLGQALPEGTMSEAASEHLEEATLGWLAGELEVSDFERRYLRAVGDGRSVAYERHFLGQPAVAVAIEGGLAGDRLQVDVTTENRRIGHRFPVGLLDLSEVWLELEVVDRDGAPVLTSGTLDDEGRVPPDARRLGAEIVDAAGEPIRRHRIWTAREVRPGRFLVPGTPLRDSFSLAAPAGARFPLTARATWRYRRYRPEFSEWVFGVGTRAPSVVLGAAEVTLAAGAARPAP